MVGCSMRGWWGALLLMRGWWGALLLLLVIFIFILVILVVFCWGCCLTGWDAHVELARKERGGTMRPFGMHGCEETQWLAAKGNEGGWGRAGGEEGQQVLVRWVERGSVVPLWVETLAWGQRRCERGEEESTLCVLAVVTLWWVGDMFDGLVQMRGDGWGGLQEWNAAKKGG